MYVYIYNGFSTIYSVFTYDKMIRNLLRNYQTREFYMWFGTVEKPDKLYISDFNLTTCPERKHSTTIKLDPEEAVETEPKKETT